MTNVELIQQNIRLRETITSMRKALRTMRAVEKDHRRKDELVAAEAQRTIVSLRRAKTLLLLQANGG